MDVTKELEYVHQRFANGGYDLAQLEYELAFWIDVEACDRCSSSMCTTHYDMLHAGAIPSWASDWDRNP